MSATDARLAVRQAVRRVLANLPAAQDQPGPVLVACSGGADSLALLAGTVAEAPATGRRVVGATVDHGLQEGSAAHAARVVEQMAALGADETLSARVQVGDPGGRGPEAAAREARYAVLEQVADHVGAAVVLLGHTLDDQAETVLMGLTRGSGGRSIAGMRRGFERYRRPLLDLRRATTEAACREAGVDFWLDPHNADPRFLRARVRTDVLPLLERELGPGVAETLARTGEQLQADLAALDDLATAHLATYDAAHGLDVHEIAALPAAVRTRMLRRAALAAGCPPSELFAVHVAALEAQVHNRTHLPRRVQLPGHVTAHRSGDHLRFEAAPVGR